MTRPHRLFAAAAVSALLVVGVAACGSSGGSDSSGSSDKATTTAAPSTEGTASTGGDDGTAGDDGSASTGKGTVKLADGEAGADKTVTFTKDGTFDPATLEVGVGELFTFKAGEGAGTHAVTFNGDDQYTISGGLIESFTIDAAGTYTATETLTNAQITITVS